MRPIFRIARIELSTLFNSAVGWLVLVLFTMQAGLVFTRYLTGFAIDQAAGFPLENLTNAIFLNRNNDAAGLLPSVMTAFYLYIPLLAMGLISRELSSGSIRLLQSSPLTNVQIVAGKFLSMMFFGLAFIAILVIFLLAADHSVVNLHASQVIGGLIGLYLLLGVYTSIGLFMSSLTIYQVIAAIGTLAALAALNYIGEIGQKIDVLRDITYQLRINGRMDQFMDGLISTKNIFYFFMLILLFTGLTVIRLDNRRSSKPLRVKAGTVLLFISGCLLLNYITSLPRLTAYFDLTPDKEQTLSPKTREIIGQLGAPLRIHAYVNILDNSYYLGSPENRNADRDFFEAYRRFLPDLSMDYIYYYDSTNQDYVYKNYPGLDLKGIAEKEASYRGENLSGILSPAEIRRVFDPAKERFQFVRELESGGRKTYLRVFNDVWTQPWETEIAAGLKRLTCPSPAIAFLAGHYERSIERYGNREYRQLANQPDFRSSLINQGFTVFTLSLAEENIPDSLRALVIADPKTPYTGTELVKIAHYVQHGGNLLIAAELEDQANLTPLLDLLGIQMSRGKLVQRNEDFAPDFVTAQFADGRDGRITMPGVAGLQFKKNGEFRIEPFLVADKVGIWKGGGGNDDSTIREEAVRLPSGYFQQMIAVAVTATRQVSGHQQRILVLGDADLLSSTELERKNVVSACNKALGPRLFQWLTDDGFPVDIALHQSSDTALTITETDASRMSLFFLGIMPEMILVLGSIFLIRRKRQ